MTPPDHTPTGPPKRTFRLWEMRSAADGEDLLRRETVDRPSFVWLEGEHAFVAELTHDRMRILVGRSPNAELPIPTNTHTKGVSRHHATIERHYDQLTIRDTSSNGTKVNAEPVRDAAALNDRDTIELSGVMTIYVRCPVLEIPGTFNLPTAPDWTRLTLKQLDTVVALLDLWENRDTTKPPSNRRIGDELGVGEATAKSHIGKTLEALDAKGRDRTWLAQLAITHEFTLREAHAAAHG